MSQTGFFFPSTRNITARLGEIFNFAWTTATALWNLRQDVRAFLKEVGQEELRKLHERFVEGSGVTSVDLRTTCLQISWDDQREQLAKFLLFDLCGLFEAWLAQSVPRSVPNRREDVIKSLQFPTQLGKALCFANGISRVNADPSSVMKAEIFPTLKAHQKNSWKHMDDLLTAYRYFKEVRNATIHSGAIADQRVMDSRAALSVIPYRNLGLKKGLATDRRLGIL